MVKDYSRLYLSEDARKIFLEFANKMDMSDIQKKINESAINEKAGGIINLDEVEELVNGMEFSWKDIGSIDTDKSKNLGRSYVRDFDISFMFFNNNTVKSINKDHNSLTFTFTHMDEDLSDIHVTGPYSVESVETEDFKGMPKNPDLRKQVEALNAISSKCDSDRIYSIYLSKAEEILEAYMTPAFEMFHNGGLVRRRVSSGTLSVGYNSSGRFFVFNYNPDFILRNAVEEYVGYPERYTSLSSCYIYLLAFYISHEMMHIITQNVSTGDSREGFEFSEIDVGDGLSNNMDIGNIVEDSFINSELCRRFSFVEGVKSDNGMTSIPHGIITDEVNFRTRSNAEGFKYYKDAGELIKVIANVLESATRVKIEKLSIGEVKNIDISYLAGADMFIKIKVDPRADEIRKSSIIYQRFINDVVKAVTDGKVLHISAPMSREEALSSQKPLEEGTLVRIVGDKSKIVYIIKGYDKDSKLYTLNKTNRGVAKKTGNGKIICSYTYSDSGDFFDNKKRSEIEVYDPSNPEDSWAEDDPNSRKDNPHTPEGTEGNQGEQGKDGGEGTEGNKPEGRQTPKSQKKNNPKTIKVGDIVYIPSIGNHGKYGKIVGMKDGKFDIEAVDIENFSYVNA